MPPSDPKSPNPLVNAYLSDGCMRCKYGGTPQCKVNDWRPELQLLRQIALESGLQEEVKWSVPVYTHNGKNIVSVNALKTSANLSFFKGALIDDTQNLLSQQGNVQAGRLARFTNSNDILSSRDILKSYIEQAIAIEERGDPVPVRTASDEPVPDELQQAFESDPGFDQAFHSLTPGRQRGYLLYFGGAVRAETRISRIESCKERIMAGEGLHDAYKRGKS